MRMLKRCIIALVVLLLPIAGYADIALDIPTPVQPVRQDLPVAGEHEPELEAKPKPISVTLVLVDGSRIIGVPSIMSIPVQMPYAKMSIPLHKIMNIEIKDDHESASFELRNGDKISAAVGLDGFDLNTAVGALSISLVHIKTIAVNRMGGNWISRDASYTASSVHGSYPPLPSLLTCAGRVYEYGVGDRMNAFAFHTQKMDLNPHIIVDLGRNKTIHNICIKNRKDLEIRAKGLTVWLSSDSTERGEKVWSTQAVLGEYTISFATPQKARFVTIGLQRRDYLHLEYVKVFGEDK